MSAAGELEVAAVVRPSRELDPARVAIAGVFVGAAIFVWLFVRFTYFRGIDDKMYEPCPMSIHLAFGGIGAAIGLVSFALAGLARRLVAQRRRLVTSRAGTLWSAVAAVWVAVVAYSLVVGLSLTQGRLLAGAECLF